MTHFTESEIEHLALEEFSRLGFSVVAGPTIAPEDTGIDSKMNFRVAEEHAAYGLAKRKDFGIVILEDELSKAIDRLNPTIPIFAREQALKTVLSIYSPQLIDTNEAFHKLLAAGVPVSIQKDGQERGEKVWLLDFQNPSKNVFHAINQFTIEERNKNKRPDIILFVNGLPLVVVELKNPADVQATIRKAYDQIQTYKNVIPSLFYYNALCVITDGLEARAGTISSSFSRFMAWKSVDGQKESSAHTGQMEVLVKGMLNKATLLDLIRSFIVFEKDKQIDTKTGLVQIETNKKVAGYHQYYAVNKAMTSTKTAMGILSSPKSASDPSHKAGVVWHTQGSGKSLSMVFYAGKLIHELDNPTLLVITDRNDLDSQLFDTFAASTQLLGQEPVQAESREQLKSLLKVASGGIVFATIQKFFPDDGSNIYEMLSERKNIIVIADEAHRTQYGFKAKLVDTKDDSGILTGKKIVYGFAKYLRDALPQATFIGFTGTPVESTDVNTPAVFGNYIDIYDIAQAVEDRATVKIYYESRLAKINLTEEGRHLIEEVEKETENDDTVRTQQAKAKWTKLEAIVGHPERLRNLAKDIIAHFEKRCEVFDGKAMIVTMSRRIAVALYQAIVDLRPDWHSEDTKSGALKVIMTSSSSDKMEYDPEDPDALVIPACHRTNKTDRKLLAERMKDPADSLKIAIVRDMWLTGFDVPCLHTMYIDKLMKKHTLMQAIARVNRVFLDKPGGLVVDYIGIGHALKEALSFYSNSGGKGDPAEMQAKALELFVEKMEVVRQMFRGFDYSAFFTTDTSRKLTVILQSEEFILAQADGKERFIKETTALSLAFALAVPHEDALKWSDEVAFFQAVRARLIKFEAGEVSQNRSYDSAIRQIINQAVESTGVVDVFDAAGIKKPDISLLSEEFLQEVKGMQHKNLALELLKKIINDEIHGRLKFNLVEGKRLLDMLESTIKKYQNNLLTTVEIIEELLKLAKEIRKVDDLADQLKLSKEEFAFYTALGLNDSAVQALGDEVLKNIAREIADKVRANTSIDWTLKESARARLMVIVKRTLNKYGYPPDKQQKAVDTVLKQAEVMAEFWVAN
jgi:type I restriction enzyme R subunit